LTKHPSNKHQRKLIAQKKHKFVDDKKGILAAQRPAKVWKKLTVETLKEQETLNELKSYRDGIVQEQHS
jgi:hypothetical protein